MKDRRPKTKDHPPLADEILLAEGKVFGLWSDLL